MQGNLLGANEEALRIFIKEGPVQLIEVKAHESDFDDGKVVKEKSVRGRMGREERRGMG